MLNGTVTITKFNLLVFMLRSKEPHYAAPFFLRDDDQLFIKYIQRVVCLFMCVVMLRLSSYWTFFISVSLI